jgi:SAM-dependent methyltransferase
MSNEQLKAAEATWDNFDLDLARRVAWTSFKLIADTGQLPLPTGHNLTTYLHSSLKERLERTTNAKDVNNLVGCALVCGDMVAERYFFELKAFVSFKYVDGFDLSGESLKKVQLDNVAFVPHHTDCNLLQLEPARYDLIVGHQGLHHIQNLKNLYRQVHSGLKANGFFFLSEWIGPNYLQIPTANKIWSLALLYIFFPSKKMRTNHMGDTKGIGFLQYGKETFDPSEACNSENLESGLLDLFTYHKCVRFGGLSYPMFEGTAMHLSENDPWTLRRVRWIVAIEKVLTKLRLIKPLFLVAICEKK